MKDLELELQEIVRLQNRIVVLTFESSNFSILSFFNLRISPIFAHFVGALAQLARASRWQCEGHRFDSDMLHSTIQGRRIFRPCLFCKDCLKI